jgi:hypothetical protein
MTTKQQKVASELRKHLALSRNQLDPVINNSLKTNNNVFFDLSDFPRDLGKIRDYQFFVSAEEEHNLGTLLDHNKIVKSKVYANFVDMQHNATGNMIFCFVPTVKLSLLDPFVLREESSYNGLGGVFCKESLKTSTGIIMEPLKNYLQYAFEVYEDKS